MNTVNCPGNQIAMNIPSDWSSNFNFVSTAYAQSASANIFADSASAVSLGMTAPFLIFILLCFLFAILMSFIFVYHWIKFGMHDPRIHSFMSVYFVGLILLSIPVIYNLIF